MKKRILFLALSALLAFCAVGCLPDSTVLKSEHSSVSSSADDSENTGAFLVPPDPKYKKQTFTVHYDYAFHVEGAATMLFSGSLPFFDCEAYGIKTPLLAGDELTVYYYDGELYVQETYPSTVRVEGKIGCVEKTTQAQIIDRCYKEGGQVRSEYGFGFIQLPEYAVNRDGSCTPFAELTDGTALCVAYAIPKIDGVDVDIDSSRICPTALYTYNPQKA